MVAQALLELSMSIINDKLKAHVDWIGVCVNRLSAETFACTGASSATAVVHLTLVMHVIVANTESPTVILLYWMASTYFFLGRGRARL